MRPEDYLPPKKGERQPPPRRPKGSKASRPPARHFHVLAWIGEGQPGTDSRHCVPSISKNGVEVRVFRSKRKRWFLPLDEAASILAIRAQKRAAELRLGTK